MRKLLTAPLFALEAFGLATVAVGVGGYVLGIYLLSLLAPEARRAAPRGRAG